MVDFLMEMTLVINIGLDKELIMRNSMAINVVHRAITILLLIIVIAFTFNYYLTNKPYNDHLYSQKQLTDKIWVYITEYQSAGATDSDIYRYYLNEKIEGNIMKIIEKTSPLMTTDNADAQVSGEENIIKINFTGRVYDFNNSPFFYVGDRPVMPTIEFNAKGVSAWK